MFEKIKIGREKMVEQIGVFCILVFSIIVFFSIVYADKTQNNIAENIIRLHIIANSDSQGDQAIKLLVRDAIIEAMSDKLTGVKSKEKSEKIVIENIDYIKETANNVLLENGFNYVANVSLGKADFPTKQYENITLPPGEYEAVRVVLGEGVGKNWWCVMFPPLCFNGATNGKVEQPSNEYLQNKLSKDSYDIISGKSPKVVMKFKVVEMFEDLRQKVQKTKMANGKK